MATQPWKEERGQDCPEPIAIKACMKDRVSGFHKWETWT